MKKAVKFAAALSAVAAISIGISGVATAKKDEAPARIVVSDAKTTHHLNLYVAQDLGYFKKRNLDVSIVEAKELSGLRMQA